MILLLCLCGTAGTLARYAVGNIAYRAWGSGFVWGTLAVNLLGCFAIGLLMQGGVASALPRELRLALVIGFLGAFTTFSAFGYDTFRYIETGATRLALLNAGANLVLGLACVWLGSLSGRALTGGAA